MGEDKHKHSTKRKHRSEHESGSSKKHKRKAKEETKTRIVDDDPNDEDLWVEKNIDMDGERPLATDIPTAESLKLKSSATANPSGPPLPPSTSTGTELKRDDWMLESHSLNTPPHRPAANRLQEMEDEPMTEGYGEPSSSSRTLSGGVDFFGSLGTEVKRKNIQTNKPDPEKPAVSSKELNADIRAGKLQDFDPAPPPTKAAVTPGGPGSSWRMMRLRRVYETAEEEGVPIEQVALERFGSLEAFEEAKEERQALDLRDGGRSNQSQERGRPSSSRNDGERGFMFNDAPGSAASSRSSSYRKPTGRNETGPSTPSPSIRPPPNRRLDNLRLPSQANSPLQQSHTPIPTVMTPSAAALPRRALSPSSLNKLQAKVLRAKLMDSPDADKLEQEYEAAARAGSGNLDDSDAPVRTRVEVLPTLDGQGRLYDVGHGRDDGVAAAGAGNRKKKEKFETRDPKTGELLRYNADDDETTLGEMLRQEKFGGGMADQKDLDAQFAQAIMGDGKFANDLDYMDDNAEKLGRQKMRSDAIKRQFAINDYKRTQKVLSTCHFCYGEDDSLPKAPIIAMGTRAYLSCTSNEELLPGHCLIVPIQHHLTMLEGDDDVWDEVRNFMKTLMQMFASEDQGVIFYETVISIRKQQHTVIECVPLPWEQYDIIPGYFKESILMSEAEWSQHKKLIDFSARPGGFRRAMVPNLPYFMVQFDHKGEKGYGHVIEGANEPTEDDGGDEGEKGGGEFPRYFAGEIIGNVLELEPRKWRHPKRMDFRMNKERVSQYRKKYDKFDWTKTIGRE